jgi:hypothetical protein
MRTLIACSPLVATLMLFAGCASVKLGDGIEPTRMKGIEQGEARKDVEAILGPPIQITKTAVGTLASYPCNLGLPRESLVTGRKESAEQPDEALRGERFLAARNAIFSFVFLGAPEIYANHQIEQQRGSAVVNYDQENRVQDTRVRCLKPAPDSEPLLKIY